MRPRKKGKRNVKPIEIPAYFPPSRYQTTNEDPVIDHENRKIISLPSILTKNINNPISINHVGPRSVKDEIIKEAESALLGESQTANESSGVHPGILYGGPAAGIFAPIGVWFFKLFKKRRKKKKQRKAKLLEDSDEEDSDEEDIQQENARRIITSAVTNQITNAGNSVVSHIKGKITETGSVLINDLKAQAIAQEEEILENIRTTVLEQEQAMVNNIKQKITNTQTSLVDDLMKKLSIFGWSRTESSNEATESSTFEEQRKVEEKLCKLSDSETELLNTVKRRISNAQDALIPEIEKGIEETNKTIIDKIENEIPEAKGPKWSRIKSGIKERSTSLFDEIKSILTCTENKIIDDVKSQMSETKSSDQSSVIMVGVHNTDDKVSVTIIQPDKEEKTSGFLKPGETKISIDKNEDMLDKQGTEIKKKSTWLNTIKTKIFPKSFFKHSHEKCTESIETKTDTHGSIKNNPNEQIEIELENTRISETIKVSQTESSNMNEIISSEESNTIKNINHDVALPLNLKKHTSSNIVQIDTLEKTQSTHHDVDEKKRDQRDNTATIIRNGMIQPELTQRTVVDTPVTVEERDMSTPTTDCNKSDKQNDYGIISSIISTTIETITHGLHIPSQFLKQPTSGVQTETIKPNIAEDNNLYRTEGNETNINIEKELIVDIEPPQLNQEIVESRTQEQEPDIYVGHSTVGDAPPIESKKEDLSEDLTILDKIKYNVSIPLQFLNFYPNPTTQTESETYDKLEEQQVNSQENDNTKPSTCNEPSHRTDPIPIPAHQTKLDRFPVTQKLDSSAEQSENSSESSSGTEHEKDHSFFDTIKNSVSYLPFNMNFSGIPDTVTSYIDSKNHDAKKEEEINTCLSEVKVVSENTATSSHLTEENAEKISEEVVEHDESRITEYTKHFRFSTDSQSAERTSSRKWIVLDYTDEEWPSHLPKNITDEASSKYKNPDQNTTMVKWLQSMEEDVNASWPNHLPKNLHITPNNTPNQKEQKKKRKQNRTNKQMQSQQDYSVSVEEENEEWKRRLPKNISLKPSDNENDRKESIVSTMSEFSTTSSIDSTSSGTLESRDSFSGYKLPNFDSKLQKKKNRNKRLKSLDSGIHHYYGEYIIIEFPSTDSGQTTSSSEAPKTMDKGECTLKPINHITSKSKYQEGEEITEKAIDGSSQKSEESSEFSQEEVKSVISATEITRTQERTSKNSGETLQVDEKEGCYEGYMVSLERQIVNSDESESSA